MPALCPIKPAPSLNRPVIHLWRWPTDAAHPIIQHPSVRFLARIDRSAPTTNRPPGYAAQPATSVGCALACNDTAEAQSWDPSLMLWHQSVGATGKPWELMENDVDAVAGPPDVGIARNVCFRAQGIIDTRTEIEAITATQYADQIARGQPNFSWYSYTSFYEDHPIVTSALRRQSNAQVGWLKFALLDPRATTEVLLPPDKTLRMLIDEAAADGYPFDDTQGVPGIAMNELFYQKFFEWFAQSVTTYAYELSVIDPCRQRWPNILFALYRCYEAPDPTRQPVSTGDVPSTATWQRWNVPNRVLRTDFNFPNLGATSTRVWGLGAESPTDVLVRLNRSRLDAAALGELPRLVAVNDPGAVGGQSTNQSFSVETIADGIRHAWLNHNCYRFTMFGNRVGGLDYDAILAVVNRAFSSHGSSSDDQTPRAAFPR